MTDLTPNSIVHASRAVTPSPTLGRSQSIRDSAGLSGNLMGLGSKKHLPVRRACIQKGGAESFKAADLQTSPARAIGSLKGSNSSKNGLVDMTQTVKALSDLALITYDIAPEILVRKTAVAVRVLGLNDNVEDARHSVSRLVNLAIHHRLDMPLPDHVSKMVDSLKEDELLQLGDSSVRGGAEQVEFTSEDWGLFLRALEKLVKGEMEVKKAEDYFSNDFLAQTTQDPETPQSSVIEVNSGFGLQSQKIVQLCSFFNNIVHHEHMSFEGSENVKLVGKEAFTTQIRRLGLNKISLDELTKIVQFAQTSGVVKGIDPGSKNQESVGSVLKDFLNYMSEGTIGYRSEHPANSENLSQRLPYRVEEERFAELCLAYDKHVSHFSSKLQDKTLKMLTLLAEYKGFDSPEAFVEHEFELHEPLQSDSKYYQGSIDSKDVIAALKDENCNFRVLMWIGLNVDDIYDHCFSRREDGVATTELENFQAWAKKNGKETDFINFAALENHVEFSREFTARTPGNHKIHLDVHEGRSIFHPRGPLIAMTRENGKHTERVSRHKIKAEKHDLRVQRARINMESEVQRRNHWQLGLVPLSIYEVKHQSPSMFNALRQKYDLSDPLQIKEALKEADEAMVETQWGSGEFVWHMNRGDTKVETVDKATGKVIHRELEISSFSRDLLKVMRMVGGVSGHVDFALHLASYFRLDLNDALISTFANLIMANAHSVGEVALGAAGFVEPAAAILNSLTYDDQMVSQLSDWVIDRTPENQRDLLREVRERPLQLIDP